MACHTDLLCIAETEQMLPHFGIRELAASSPCSISFYPQLFSRLFSCLSALSSHANYSELSSFMLSVPRPATSSFFISSIISCSKVTFVCLLIYDLPLKTMCFIFINLVQRKCLINICWISECIHLKDHSKVAYFLNFQVGDVREIQGKPKPLATDLQRILFPLEIDSLMDGTLTVLKWMLLRQFSKWLNNIVLGILLPPLDKVFSWDRIRLV